MAGSSRPSFRVDGEPNQTPPSLATARPSGAFGTANSRIVPSGATRAIRLAFGSDWPVVTPDVFRGLYCAVARRTREGKPEGGWQPQLAVSAESALRNYTIDAAFAGFSEKERGSIAVGKRADLVVLSRDVLSGPPEEILGTKVLLTLFGGTTAWQDPELR